MDLGLYIAASGMVADQTRQTQLSNDLANASTPGYKPERFPQRSFGQLLLANTSTGQTIGTMNTGVQLGHSVLDMAPAGMQSTGQPLDFGYLGTGFFAVKTPRGCATRATASSPPPPPGSSWTAPATPSSARAAPRSRRAEGTVLPGSLGLFNVPGAVSRAKPLHRHALRAGHRDQCVRGCLRNRASIRRARWSR